MDIIFILFLTYFLLGAGVKYIDAAYDDGTFSKKPGLVLAVSLGIAAGLTMILTKPSLTIFLSVIIGVAITGKLDIGPFKVMATIALLLPYTYHNGSFPFSHNEWIAVLCISTAAAIDEIGNDLADAKVPVGFLARFFKFRGCLKILIVLTAILNYLPVTYSVAFLFFDLGYLLVTFESERRKKETFPSIKAAECVNEKPWPVV